MPSTSEIKRGHTHAGDLVEVLHSQEAGGAASSSKHGLRNSLYAASAKSVASVSAWISRKTKPEPCEEEKQLNNRLLEQLRAHLTPGFDSTVVMDELSHYTLAEKYTMLQEFESEATERKAERSPAEVLNLLKEPMRLTATEAKLVETTLASCSSEWLGKFVAEGGVEWLLECLRFSVYWCRSLNRLEASTAESIVQKGSSSSGGTQAFPGIKLEIVPEAADAGTSVSPSQKQHLQRLDSLFHAALDFFRKANAEQQERIFSHRSCLVGVLRSLDFVSKRLLSESFFLFAGMSVLSPEHREAVVEAWDAAAVPKQLFFKASLLPELRKGRDFQLKLAYFTFANIFILHRHTVAGRWHTRLEYLPVKLIRKFVRFVSLYPDEDFAFQLSKFREELLGDVEAFTELAEANAAYLDVALPCWREVSCDAPRAPVEESDDQLELEGEQESEGDCAGKGPAAVITPPTEDAPQPPSDESVEQPGEDSSAMDEPVPDTPESNSAEDSPAPALADTATAPEPADDSVADAAPPPPPPGNGPAPPPPPGPPPMGGLNSVKDPSRPKMRPFRIAKLGNVAGTMFERTLVEEFEDDFNWEHLEQNFAKGASKPSSASAAKKTTTAAHPQKSSHVSFLNSRGAQPTFAVQIILRGFAMNRDEPAQPDEIVERLAASDQEFFSTSELEKLGSLFPREHSSSGELKFPREEEMAKAVTEEELATYDKAERFMHSLYMLGAPADKITVMIEARALPKTAAEIPAKLEVIKAVIERLRDQRVYDFLAAVVATANYMNNKANIAHGMELQSLEKLSSVRTVDGSRSLLHVLIEMLTEKKPELVKLDDILEPRKDFMHAQRAMAVLIEYQKELKNGLATVRKTQYYEEGEPWTAVEDSLSQLQAELEEVTKSMEFLGYTDAKTDPTGFFALWSSFLKTYRVSRQWVEDKSKATGKASSRKQLLHSAQSLTATFKGNEDHSDSSNHCRPLAIPSAISLLASSADFHDSLRGSRENSLLAALRKSQQE